MTTDKVHKLALLGGTPVRKDPFAPWPLAGEREMVLLREVLESGKWSSRGPQETEFERCFSETCGISSAQCVANGSVALELALRALRIGPGDEVVVPALTWTATAWAVLQVGATPVFADVLRDDWCLDPAALRKSISKATRAVIPVHLYDQVAEMDEIMSISRQFSLAVVEDCAHALAAKWQERHAGTIGHLGTFSFQAQKTISSGEGGAIITSDEGLADRVFALKDCGRPRRPGSATGLGGNYRISEFQAAILRAQLERLPRQLEIKHRNLALLQETLQNVEGVDLLPVKPEVTRGGLHAVALRYDPEAFDGLQRDILVEALRAEGIPVQAPYRVVYHSELWTGGAEFLRPGTAVEQLGLDSSCPVAESIANCEGMVLPHRVLLGEAGNVTDIINALIKVKENRAQLKQRNLLARLRQKALRVKQRYGF